VVAEQSEVNKVVSNVRREARGHFRNKEKECLKDKIKELESSRIRKSDTSIGT
jgi:hypothetical protein